MSEHLPAPTNGAVAHTRDYGLEEIDLIKQTVAKGATDTELRLFLYQCQRTGLDPLLRQIHAVKRWDSKARREVMAIQVGIDGYRLVAERTGCYAGSDEPEFGETVQDGGFDVPSWARVTVYKMVQGQRCPFTARVEWSEYAARKKSGDLNSFWSRMPRTMLAKVAEAQALRRAFPAELSGTHTAAEMDQAAAPAQRDPALDLMHQIRQALIDSGIPQGEWDAAIQRASGSWGIDALRRREPTVEQLEACLDGLTQGKEADEEPEFIPAGEENPL